MDKNKSKLATAVATRRCVLFAGSGLTLSSGGASWDDLIQFLKDKFEYSSPLKDNFKIIGDMHKTIDPEAIYNAVQDKLKDVCINEPISKLTELPWFATFTTNYDTGLEKSLVTNQSSSRSICTILTGQEFVLTGLPEEMLCIKLMGSSDRNYGQQGSMVLTPSDLVRAKEQRSRIFDMLASHAANLSFLFVGYSFNDGVFLEILDKIIEGVGEPKQSFYAVFKDQPDEENSYLLERSNVNIIVEDLDIFAEDLSKEVSIQNPRDLTRKRIPIGSDVISIDSRNVGNFLELHAPVLFEDLEKGVSADDFLKGNTDSFKPFDLRWHYPRKEKEKVLSAILNKKSGREQSGIVTVTGSPGSGRTFVILDTIFDLITKHRTLAVKIPDYTFNQIPNEEDIEMFIEEVERASKEANVEGFERIVFWAEFTPEPRLISKFKLLSSTCDKYPMSFIFEGIKDTGMNGDYPKMGEGALVDVDDDMSEEDKKDLVQYLEKTIHDHLLPPITREKIEEIIYEEKKYLFIMYRTLDPARRSINRIIQDEFDKIQDVSVQACISLCSYSTSLNLEIPLAVLRKALGNRIRKSFSYQDVYDIALEKNKEFIRNTIDSHTNPLFSIYHPLIAQHLVKMIGVSEMNTYLMDIVKTVDIRVPVEARFIGKLLIDKGVRLKPSVFRPFTDEGLEEALLEIKKQQPARPLIHHLARFYSYKNQQDSRIIPLLEEALVEPKELYALEERKENILTTLANTKWIQDKNYLLTKSREYWGIQEIIDILIEAREDVDFNPHPYTVQARILKELASSKYSGERMALINEALELTAEGLELCKSYSYSCDKLDELKMDLLLEIDPDKAEITAKELLETKNDGTGYYTLARMEYDNNQDLIKTNTLLDKAIQAEKCPPGAIALKIEILIHGESPDYNYLLNLVNRLSFDIQHRDGWKSAYHKAAVYAMNGKYQDAMKHFKLSNRLAPRVRPKNVEIFSMENGHRKVYYGNIGRTFTEREGRIWQHDLDGWRDDLFFDPRYQKCKHKLRKGLYVNYELGFSIRGPIAFDVRPYGREVCK